MRFYLIFDEVIRILMSKLFNSCFFSSKFMDNTAKVKNFPNRYSRKIVISFLGDTYVRTFVNVSRPTVMC